jgi:hypothetical protein
MFCERGEISIIARVILVISSSAPKGCRDHTGSGQVAYSYQLYSQQEVKKAYMLMSQEPSWQSATYKDSEGGKGLTVTIGNTNEVDILPFKLSSRKG